MKKINLLIIASVLFCSGFAQQFPLQSQYQFNYPTINPAANGENDFYRARASFREQWVGLTENPISTQILTVTKRFDNNGVGLTVFSDKTGGIFNKTGFAASYSQRVKFERSDLFLGISAGTSKFNFGSSDDPIFNTTNEAKIPEVAFGVYYVYNDFRFGVSVPGLLQKDIDISNSDENTIDRHLYTMASYQKKINEDWSIYPSILFKTTANHNQIDANINFKVKNTLWFGTSYRQDFGPTLYVGIDLGRLLSVYSIDISTNQVAEYSSGSHELTFGYDFIPEDEVEQEVSDKGLIFDQDKDGVQDEDDICPREYGDPYANGCPDFDKDGVPDKFDLCPHLFGNTKMQGCPELTVNEQRILNNALADLKFGFDKDELEYESYSTLTKLVVLMHSNPALHLLINGFASSEGTESYNLNLSASRVKSVQNFFLERGITRNRLIMDFYGEESPLNSNMTEQERAENRRVEFDIRYHLNDTRTAVELKNEYEALLANIYAKDSFFPSKDPIVVQKEIMTEEVVPVEEEEGMELEEIIKSLQEEDVVIEEVVSVESVEEVVQEESIEENIDEPEIVEANTGIEGNNINRYLLIEHVLTDIANAKKYVSANDGAQYIRNGSRYYVFEFSTNQREEAERFRSESKKDCWILDYQ